MHSSLHLFLGTFLNFLLSFLVFVLRLKSLYTWKRYCLPSAVCTSWYSRLERLTLVLSLVSTALYGLFVIVFVVLAIRMDCCIVLCISMVRSFAFWFVLLADLALYVAVFLFQLTFFILNLLYVVKSCWSCSGKTDHIVITNCRLPSNIPASDPPHVLIG